MAKYTINYSCGHGSTEKHLYGKKDERYRKIAWMEDNMLCPKCYMATKKEVPLTAKLINNIYSNGYYLAVVSGDSYSIKDKLKSIGCRWLDYYENDDILGIKKPKKAWMIKIDMDDNKELKTVISKMHDIGIKEFKTDDSILSCLNAELAKELNNA